LHYGTPINPSSPSVVPGGSCSGSAVAVSAQLVDFALGILLVDFYSLEISSACICTYPCDEVFFRDMRLFASQKTCNLHM
jgi:hypothetical protein